jgi:hypothetical protein
MPWKESRTMASYCDRDEIKAAVEVVQAASTQNECQTAYVPPPKVSADQESWVKARIKTVVRAALLLSRAQEVRADQDIVICGIDGIANGAAVEIIRTLGMDPSYVNLRKPPTSDNIGHGMHNP